MSASKSHPTAPQDAVRTLATRHVEASLVRLGPPGFGGNPTFVAIAPNEQSVATSIGMAGAEVELFDAQGQRVGVLQVDLERAVRALDFSLDGTTLLVSLTGGSKKASALQFVSVPAGKVVREVSLAADERGADAHFLADGSVVAATHDQLVQWPAGGAKPRELEALPSDARLSTSADKRWLVVATRDAVTLRAAAQPGTVVMRRPRQEDTWSWNVGRGRAFVANDGAMLLQEGDDVLLVEKGGHISRLGPGVPRGLGTRWALIGSSQRAKLELIRRVSPNARTLTLGERAWLSPAETTIYAHTGHDAADALSAIPVDGVIAGTTTMHGRPATNLAFSADGKDVWVGDGSRLVKWNVQSHDREDEIAVPFGPVDGMFRRGEDLFLMAGGVFARFTNHQLRKVGDTHYRRPSAFERHDGTTVICMRDARAVCDSYFVLGVGEEQMRDVMWGYLFPLSADRALLEGPYMEEGIDVGWSRPFVRDPREANGEVPTVEETWLKSVYVHDAVPTESGGFLATWEGAERRNLVLRRVTSTGLGASCALGELRPTTGGMSVAPNGLMVAMPSVDHLLSFVDVDSCVGLSVTLPSDAVALDFAPDGNSIAVGLRDRSLAVVSVPRRTQCRRPSAAGQQAFPTNAPPVP